MLPKFLKPYQINNSNLIRIGPKRDGGYVIDNRIIKKTNNLITCGLNDDWEFEKVSHIDGGFGAIKQSKFEIV